MKRFQNSALMGKDDEYRPLVFVSRGPEKGRREDFPSPMAASSSLPLIPQVHEGPTGLSSLAIAIKGKKQQSFVGVYSWGPLFFLFYNESRPRQGVAKVISVFCWSAISSCQGGDLKCINTYRQPRTAPPLRQVLLTGHSTFLNIIEHAVRNMGVDPLPHFIFQSLQFGYITSQRRLRVYLIKFLHCIGSLSLI